MIRWTSVLLLVLASTTAVADPETGDRLATEARELDEKGRFREAADKFAAAAKADPRHPELFCNIGISYYKAHDLPRAHLMLGRCIERGALKADFVVTVRDALNSVEATLRAAGHTPVTIELVAGPASVRIVELFEDEAFVGTRTVWLPFGTYHIVAKADGFVDETVEIVAATQETMVVPITLRKPVIAKPRQVTAERPSRLPAYLASGATLAAMIVAGVALVEGRARADLAKSALVLEAFEDDRAAVKTWNTTLGIAGALAIVGGGISGYLWYRAFQAPARIEVAPTAGGASVTVGGRF